MKRRRPTRYSGKRHNRELFTWLARAALGTASTSRGDVDAATGTIIFHRGWKGVACGRK